MTTAATLLSAPLTVLGLLIGWARLRTRLRRPAPAEGDRRLAAVLDRLTPRAARRVAAVLVENSATGTATRQAYVNADPGTRFEVGSVSKALTGLALAAVIGPDGLDRSLASIDPRYAGSALGELPLRAFCTHRSGLPSIPRGPGMLARVIWSVFTGANPYRGLDSDDVARDALRQRLSPGPAPSYSNLGAAVLGNALAARAGVTFPRLLRAQVLDPLGMRATGFARAARGWTATGRRSAPWVMPGYAPAGGVTSTPADLARLLDALLLNTAPGLAALTPIDSGFGMFWLVRDLPGGGRRWWHNGETGGYSSFLAVDPDRGRGVAVLADVADAAAIERIALAVLDVPS